MNDDTLFDEIGCEEIAEADHEAVMLEVSEEERQLRADELCGLDQYFDPIE